MPKPEVVTCKLTWTAAQIVVPPTSTRPLSVLIELSKSASSNHPSPARVFGKLAPSRCSDLVALSVEDLKFFSGGLAVTPYAA